MADQWSGLGSGQGSGQRTVKYFNEVRSSKIRTGPLSLVPTEELGNHVGFQSVYSFPEDLASMLLKRGHTRDLSVEDVYSSVLYLDYDENPEAAARFKEYLIQHNLRFEQFNSGGRSVHYHVAIEPMLGTNVATSQLEWTGIHAPGRDPSIYRPAAMWRMEGTYHAKTRGRKEIVDSRDGNALVIPSVERVIAKREFEPRSEEGEHRSIVSFLVMQEVYKGGGRNPHAFKIAAHCRDAGIDSIETRKIIGNWSETNSHPPLRERELDTLIRSAFR